MVLGRSQEAKPLLRDFQITGTEVSVACAIILVLVVFCCCAHSFRNSFKEVLLYATLAWREGLPDGTGNPCNWFKLLNSI